MEPLGVHHVSINVADADAAIAFYTDVLGCRVRDDRPDFGIGGAWLDLADQQIHLIEQEVPSHRGQHFAIRVADIDGAVAEVRSRGIEVGDPSVIGTGRQAFLSDPSGNLIELHEPAAAS